MSHEFMNYENENHEQFEIVVADITNLISNIEKILIQTLLIWAESDVNENEPFCNYVKNKNIVSEKPNNQITNN